MWQPRTSHTDQLQTLSQSQQSEHDTTEKHPAASGTTEHDHSTFVDAAETLTDVAETSAAETSEVVSQMVDATKSPRLKSPLFKAPTPTPQSPLRVKGKTPLKTYGKSGTLGRTKS